MHETLNRGTHITISSTALDKLMYTEFGNTRVYR